MFLTSTLCGITDCDTTADNPLPIIVSPSV
jgi:hypothetical protein